MILHVWIMKIHFGEIDVFIREEWDLCIMLELWVLENRQPTCCPGEQLVAWQTSGTPGRELSATPKLCIMLELWGLGDKAACWLACKQLGPCRCTG